MDYFILFWTTSFKKVLAKYMFKRKHLTRGCCRFWKFDEKLSGAN